MFKPKCLPILIGSLPLQDHAEAVRTILLHSPEIPLWPQLPKLPKEGMVRQFLSGFPGLHDDGKRYWIDTDSDDFAEQMAEFYEEFMLVEKKSALLQKSRFALQDDTAKGFRVFTDLLQELGHKPITIKGQVTGPVTVGIGTKDQHGQSIFYDENLRDILVKHLSLKGRWQVEALSKFSDRIQPIVFIDEPAIVSFGSPGFMGITKEMVSESVAEVVQSIQTACGLAGIHICANGDWSLALSSTADIISFDAYSYFDNFILFKDQLINFLHRGGMLAWGIIPTGDPEILENIDAEKLFLKWQKQLHVLSDFGIPQNTIMEQTFIAPSCGTGSLSPQLALKVMQLTKDVSKQAQQMLNHYK